MTDDRKGLVKELVITGIAPPFLMLLLNFTSGFRGLILIFLPILYLGRGICWLIELVFPPGGGWFAGLGTALIVDFVLIWIAMWMVLFGLVRLADRRINRKKREA